MRKAAGLIFALCGAFLVLNDFLVSAGFYRLSMTPAELLVKVAGLVLIGVALLQFGGKP